MSNWKEIISQHDLANFLELYGGFHDCCLKELRYVSGAFVNKDLAMKPINDQRKLLVLFHRQSENNPVVELEFSYLESLNLKPLNHEYTCEIFDASMYFENGKIYWADSSDFIKQQEAYNGTWICAEKIRWRFVEKYIGNEEIY